jgi:hypothetical protein
VFIGHRRITYSHATKMLRGILAEVGLKAVTVTDKSLKMLLLYHFNCETLSKCHDLGVF